MGKDTKFAWKEEHAKAFEMVKQVLMDKVKLTHPDFDEPFKTHTDASKCQLGLVITQDNKPTVHFSRKLNESQRNCTAMELELLATVKT